MSRTHGGKGSKARPKSVDGEEFADNWERIFNRSAVDEIPSVAVAADVMSGNDPIIEDPDPAAIFNRDHWSLITGNYEMNGTNFELAGDFMNCLRSRCIRHTYSSRTEPSQATTRTDSRRG